MQQFQASEALTSDESWSFASPLRMWVRSFRRGRDDWRQKYTDLLSERLELLSADPEDCWRDLEELSQRMETKHGLDRIDLDSGFALVEAIARRGDPFVGRVLEILRRRVRQSSGQLLMEGFAIQLAGLLRLEAAVPLLVDKLKSDAAWRKEECAHALAGIGTDQVVESLARQFPREDWGFRMFAAGVFQRVHSDRAVEICLDLFHGEKDASVARFLAEALPPQLTTEGVEPVGQLILQGKDRPERLDREAIPAPAARRTRHAA